MSKSKEALGRIRDLPADELGQAAERARDELFRLKLSSYTNQVQDTASLRNKRREVARILTVMTARAQGRDVQAAAPAASAAPAAKPAKAKPSAAKTPAAKPAKKTTKKKEG